MKSLLETLKQPINVRIFTLTLHCVSYLIQLSLGDVQSLSSFSQGLKGVDDFLTRTDIFRLAADHEGHVLSHGNDTVTMNKEKITFKKTLTLIARISNRAVFK